MSTERPGLRVEFLGVDTEFVPHERVVGKYSLAFEDTWAHTFARRSPGPG